jgi:hypothetical protein
MPRRHKLGIENFQFLIFSASQNLSAPSLYIAGDYEQNGEKLEKY